VLWVNYTTTLLADYQVSWAEFHKAFHGHHILDGPMDRKMQEFLDLKQGSGSMYE
jgi:hypothetical protein